MGQHLFGWSLIHGKRGNITARMNKSNEQQRWFDFKRAWPATVPSYSTRVGYVNQCTACATTSNQFVHVQALHLLCQKPSGLRTVYKVAAMYIRVGNTSLIHNRPATNDRALWCLRISRTADHFRRAEPQINLAVCRGFGIGTVHDVPTATIPHNGDITTNGAWRRIYWARGTDHHAAYFHNVYSFPHHRQNRTGRDEVDQCGEERAAFVLLVVGLSDLTSRDHDFGGQQLVPSLLEA